MSNQQTHLDETAALTQAKADLSEAGYDSVSTIKNAGSTFIVNIPNDNKLHVRNIDRKPIFIQELNRSKYATKNPIYSDSLLAALDKIQEDIIKQHTTEWENKHRNATYDLKHNVRPPIAITHDLYLVFGRIDSPQNLLKVKLTSIKDGESYNRIIESQAHDFVAILAGAPNINPADLNYIPVQNGYDYAIKYNLATLVCMQGGYLNDAIKFNNKLTTLGNLPQPRSAKNSLSNKKIIFWKSYAKKHLLINNGLQKCTNVLEKKLPKVDRIDLSQKHLKVSRILYAAYNDLLNGVGYLIDLCIEHNLLYADKPVLNSKYSANELKKYLKKLDNSVKNAIAVSIIAPKITYAVQNGVSVYIDLLPTGFTGETKNSVIDKVNDIIKIIDRIVIRYNQVPSHILYLLNFFKNLMANELSVGGNSLFAKIPLDIRSFLLSPQIVRAGEILFDKLPYATNISFYFDESKATQSLEQINCVECGVFSFEPSIPDAAKRHQDKDNHNYPLIINAVDATPASWSNDPTTASLSLIFHEPHKINIRTSGQVLDLITKHFKQVLAPIFEYMSGLCAREVININSDINTNIDHAEFNKLNDEQKMVYGYQLLHQTMTFTTYQFIQSINKNEIVLKAIRITPKPGCIDTADDNLALPILANYFKLPVTLPHQYFSKGGEMLVDLGYDKDNRRFCFYLGSNEIIELPGHFPDDIWEYPFDDTIPNTHYIEPMPFIIDLPDNKLGDYTSNILNKWFNTLPDFSDDLLYDAVDYNENRNPNVLVKYIMGLERIGRLA